MAPMKWIVALPFLNVGAVGLAPKAEPTTLSTASYSDVEVPEVGKYDFEAVSPSVLHLISVDESIAGKVRAAAAGGASKAVVAMETSTGKLALREAAEKSDQWMPVAWANYKNEVSKNGWGHFSVSATDSAKVSRELRMYSAGFLEGILTAGQMKDFQINTLAGMKDSESQHHAMGGVKEMFSNQVKNVLNKTSKANLAKLSAEDRQWYEQARFALLQAWGTLDGYNHEVDHVKGKKMAMVDLLVMNSDGETPELEEAFDYGEVALRESKQEGGDGVSLIEKKSITKRLRGKKPQVKMTPEQVQKYWRHIKESGGRCSALVRLTKDKKDLLVGHSTFSDYSEMNRIFKYYDLPLGDGVARKMGFSSYPGVAGSTDDYYLMDSGLVVTETTISLLSDEPYDGLKDTDSHLPDFLRIMLANRLAKTGKDWVSLMSKSATGTYSSQWMVVDYNKFKPGQTVQNDTLLVLEQIPGISHAEDESHRLESTGYWGSENRAVFKDVRDKSGSTDKEDLYGSTFSADKNPRAKIFAASADKVQSLAEMRSEMRRNKWPYETSLAETENTPDHAIAARGDLRKDSPSANGAVDAKVTNSCLVKLLQCEAISGPSAADQKPFKWTSDDGKELFPDMTHSGLPNLWNFDWVRMTDAGTAALDGTTCA
eukprot:TRINITY_DN79766_c0_g1_i1.p1 TRINITY_DN79766_c0_g1~~TRINITY_DN79766_c0_g1_i1.p1  ORF type:complete len:656 (+),score=180.85 TRINITY_DN79766_c0_g1_i1:128-2095(+)